jgi:hypothetical protein
MDQWDELVKVDYEEMLFNESAEHTSESDDSSEYSEIYSGLPINIHEL